MTLLPVPAFGAFGPTTATDSYQSTMHKLQGGTLRPAVAADRAAWTANGPARIGDSGSPVFLPFHGRAVSMCHFFFASGGPSTGFYTAAINAITGPEYSVIEANFASAAGPQAVRAEAAIKWTPLLWKRAPWTARRAH